MCIRDRLHAVGRAQDRQSDLQGLCRCAERFLDRAQAPTDQYPRQLFRHACGAVLRHPLSRPHHPPGDDRHRHWAARHVGGAEAEAHRHPRGPDRQRGLRVRRPRECAAGAGRFCANDRAGARCGAGDQPARLHARGQARAGRRLQPRGGRASPDLPGADDLGQCRQGQSDRQERGDPRQGAQAGTARGARRLWPPARGRGARNRQQDAAKLLCGIDLTRRRARLPSRSRGLSDDRNVAMRGVQAFSRCFSFSVECGNILSAGRERPVGIFSWSDSSRHRRRNGRRPRAFPRR